MSIDVEALIAGAKKAFEQVEPDDVQILMGEELVTVRLWPLTGQAWRELAAQYPARLERDEAGKSIVVQADRAFNYNADELTRNYPRVAIVDGDDVKDLTVELWGRILDVLDGPGFEGVAATIFYLNVVIPAQRQAQAGKASRAVVKKKQPSRGSSASRSGNSTGGRRRK